MASYNKFHAFVEHMAEGVHNLGADDLMIYLSNAAPDAAADSIKTDLAEIATGNGYTGPEAVTVTASAQSAGTYKLVLSDVTITASGGSIAEFRYVVLYNDTPTSPADPLIAWWDYGSGLTLADGESILIDFNASNGVLQIA